MASNTGPRAPRGPFKHLLIDSAWVAALLVATNSAYFFIFDSLPNAGLLGDDDRLLGVIGLAAYLAVPTFSLAFVVGGAYWLYVRNALSRIKPAHVALLAIAPLGLWILLILPAGSRSFETFILFEIHLFFPLFAAPGVSLACAVARTPKGLHWSRSRTAWCTALACGCIYSVTFFA